MLPWVGWWVQLVVNGGLGSAFDELSLNLAACEKGGAEVAGVLVNKIKLLTAGRSDIEFSVTRPPPARSEAGDFFRSEIRFL